MSEQTGNGRQRPEIRGKVIKVMDEWRNNAGTFWKREAVIETGLRYPNPLKVTFKKDDADLLEGVSEGDCVIVPYLLDGREYDGRYYVDIIGTGLQKVEGASAPAKKPVVGCTAATAVEAWSKRHGDDKAGFAEFCKMQKPGKPSKEYNLGDWADIVNAINAADAAPAEEAAGDTDDLPF